MAMMHQSAKMEGFHITLTANGLKSLMLFLIGFEVIGAIVYLASSATGHEYVHRAFWLVGEERMYTWFSAVQLFVIGLLFCWHRHWPGIDRVARSGFLIVVAIGFFFLSIDEQSEVHELITQRLKHYEWAPRWFRGNHGIWIPFYLLITSTLIIAGLRTGISMLKVYPRQTIYMVFGFVLAGFAAIGLEIVGYLYMRSLNRGLLYMIELTVEEFLEMFGMTMVLYGVLQCAICNTDRSAEAS